MRDDGRFLKAVIMDHWKSYSEVRILNRPCGLELSLCTGIARRVKLRELLYGQVLAYLRSRLRPREWSSVTQHAAGGVDISSLPSMSDTEFIQYMATQSESQFKVLRKITELLLLAMEPTGVKEEGRALVLWWPEEHESVERGLRVYKHQCSGDKPWVSMLAESETCAVFGLATARCLEHTDVKRCLNPQQGNWDGVNYIMLYTTLIPASLELNARPLSYSRSRDYFVWQKHEFLKVTRSAQTPGSVVRLTLGTRKMPRAVKKRMAHKWAEVRERDTPGGSEQNVLVL